MVPIFSQRFLEEPQLKQESHRSPNPNRNGRVPGLPLLCLILLRCITCHNMSRHIKQNPKLSEKTLGERNGEASWGEVEAVTSQQALGWSVHGW